MSNTHTLTREQIQAITLVGAVVTLDSQQYTVHSVEGVDWYAFNDNGATTVDMGMTRSAWITRPLATLVPAGCKIGEGFAKEGIPVSWLRRGVSLAKAYA